MNGPTLALTIQGDILTPTVIGVIQGSVYGLMALGLVLLYKSNRIFNFAQGEFGTVAALVCLYFFTGRGIFPQWGYVPSALMGLFAGVLMAVLTERLVVRPLFHRPKVTLVVATAGVALLAIALELTYQGPNLAALQAPTRKTAFSLFGTLNDPQSLKISWAYVIILLTLISLAVGTALFFNRTPYGVAILAVSQEPTAASVVGISVSQISLITWGLAGFLGATAGVVIAPISLITPGFLTLSGALIAGFTAAVLGGMTSLPGAFAGGLIIGVAQQFAGRIPSEVIPGADRVAIALALLAVLLFRPAGLFGKEA